MRSLADTIIIMPVVASRIITGYSNFSMSRERRKSRDSRIAAPEPIRVSTLVNRAKSSTTKDPPKVKGDVLGPDLVLYRYFPGHGLQFHPLGVFGALNAHLVAGRLDDARRLADALAARAIPGGGGAV